jgi:hypothetical protein
MIAALDALNGLVAYLCEFSTGRNVNLLFSFAGWAFHRHHNIMLAGHDEVYHDLGRRPLEWALPGL